MGPAPLAIHFGRVWNVLEGSVGGCPGVATEGFHAIDVIAYIYIYVYVAWTFRVYLAILVGLVFKLQQHHGDKDDDDRV